MFVQRDSLVQHPKIDALFFMEKSDKFLFADDWVKTAYRCDILLFSYIGKMEAVSRQEKVWPELDTGTPVGSCAASRFTSTPHASKAVCLLRAKKQKAPHRRGAFWACPQSDRSAIFEDYEEGSASSTADEQNLKRVAK